MPSTVDPDLYHRKMLHRLDEHYACKLSNLYRRWLALPGACERPTVGDLLTIASPEWLREFGINLESFETLRWVEGTRRGADEPYSTRSEMFQMLLARLRRKAK